MDAEFEIAVQPKQFPDRVVYPSASITATVPVAVFGIGLTVAVTIKVNGEGRPGSAGHSGCPAGHDSQPRPRTRRRPINGCT
jgi:hypothetical protein